VVWPESATPYPLEDDPIARSMVGEVAPPGGYVLTGGERFDLASEPPVAWNSLFVIDDAGALAGRYDKRELVPFGEYLPFRALLGQPGLGTLTRGTIDFHPGPGAVTLELPGLPPFSPLICYEVIFPGAVVEPGARPAWLLNVTNDAWFGRSSGPYQHLAMARMRSVEQGLPLVRSANTGISAVIDPWGREQARMELGEMGTLDADLPQALPATPFARYGFWPVTLLALVLAGGAAAIEVRARAARTKVNKSTKPGTN
jgi:apolipoprotein N-acyltransferase